tara:strand:+ start:1967 stop:2305 length:339 start_codon:yes stop_codon:yes gene_type:complete
MRFTRHQLRKLIRETLDLDISGHVPIVKKLLRMKPKYAQQLALALEEAHPGVEDAWALAMFQKYNKEFKSVGLNYNSMTDKEWDYWSDWSDIATSYTEKYYNQQLTDNEQLA